MKKYDIGVGIFSRFLMVSVVSCHCGKDLWELKKKRVRKWGHVQYEESMHPTLPGGLVKFWSFTQLLDHNLITISEMSPSLHSLSSQISLLVDDYSRWHSFSQIELMRTWRREYWQWEDWKRENREASALLIRERPQIGKWGLRMTSGREFESGASFKVLAEWFDS